jgi:hypothetical protein
MTRQKCPLSQCSNHEGSEPHEESGEFHSLVRQIPQFGNVR